MSKAHKKSLLFAILLFLISTGLMASPQQVYFLKANKAYSEGAFTTAAELYQKVVAFGYESPELYYNLGNSYFKLNDFAGAILWYERAKRIDPGNEDIHFNLKVANNKIADKIEPLPELFYKRWYNNIVQLFSVDAWAISGIVLLVFALGLGSVYLVSRALIFRKIGFWAGNILLILALLSFLFTWSGYLALRSTNQAIVFSPTITVKSSPDEKSTDLFVVHEGTKVRLLDNISGWYEIKIANGSVGWLPATALEKI